MLLGIWDFLSIVLAYYLALWLRFDDVSRIPSIFMEVFCRTVLFHALLAVVIYCFAHLYNRVWRFVGYRELIRCISIILYFIAVSILVSHSNLFNIKGRMPLSYFAFGGLFQVTLLVASRFIWRMMWLLFQRTTSSKSGKAEFAMLIGAGSAGSSFCVTFQQP